VYIHYMEGVDEDLSTTFKGYDEDPIPIAFGSNQELELELSDTGDTLFRVGGRLLVISVPFLEGSHVPTTIAQVKAAWDHLQALHAKDQVHGDIRLLNIVFGQDGSFLIDFDFGGTANAVVYPFGYETDLQDASGRPSDSVYACITKDQDNCAFAETIRRKFKVTAATQDYSVLVALGALSGYSGQAWLKALFKLDPSKFLFQMENDAREYIEKHGKCGARASARTRQGDAISPPKANKYVDKQFMDSFFVLTLT
jgi:serine/threonine protein kinase